MKSRHVLLLSTALIAAGGALGWQQVAAKLPLPFHTPSVRNGPRVIPQPDGAQLQVPQGFAIAEFASGFEKPRTMLYGPSGELLLADSVKNGSVYILFDKDNNNQIEDRKALITGLDRPYGMAWWKNYLYVAESTSVKRYPYNAKAMTVGVGQEVVPMAQFGSGHWTRTIAFDPKGEKLYVGIGSASNVSTGEPEERAAITRYNPDGTGKEIFASGLRNPTAIHFYPGTNTLLASVQERDELGDDLVPDYFTAVRQGAFYGWPYAYIGPNEDPRNKGQRTDLVQKTVVPDVPLGAHVAVIDWAIYNGKQFPKQYQGGAFVALHGSWNRSKRVGQSVVYVPVQNGKPSGPPQEFLKGWMISPDSRDVWGRPTGVMQMKDGSLLVSDDGGNKIWRITYKG